MRNKNLILISTVVARLYENSSNWDLIHEAMKWVTTGIWRFYGWLFRNHKKRNNFCWCVLWVNLIWWEQMSSGYLSNGKSRTTRGDIWEKKRIVAKNCQSPSGYTWCTFLEFPWSYSLSTPIKMCINTYFQVFFTCEVQIDDSSSSTANLAFLFALLPLFHKALLPSCR